MTASPPEVSVLVPVYNAERSLPLALQSLCRQTYPDWECLLCDDGSTDASLRIAETYAKKDARFVVVRRPHAGLVATLNGGLEVCRGTYVARFDADDIAHRERLGAQRQFLSDHPEFAGVGCAVRLFPRAHLAKGRRDYETWLNTMRDEGDIVRDRFVECPIAHPTWFVKRNVLGAFGYRDRGWPEDYDLFLRLLGAGHRLSTVPRRLVCWRDAPSRLSRTSAAYAIESFTKCRAHFLASDWLAKTERYGLWGYGSTGKGLARALAMHGKLPAYIVELHRGRIGQRIRQAPVIAPEQLANHWQPGDKMILSVAGLTQRAEVRRLAARFGLVENVDFVCAA
jgi:glycosyltransferase involved in cell wall biosynthesis